MPWVAGVAFVGAFVSRSVWLSEAQFHPDESTVLWMALDAVRDLRIPDHGLISTYRVFQPPGLVWVTMPFVAIGRGRPEIVILGFAALNAAAIAFLVATVARLWGLAYAVALGAFLVVGPDAAMSALVWHPSLYTAAAALMLAAGIRLRDGSPWWSAVLVAVPGMYALVHYSGIVLFAPAVVLLLLGRRRWRELSRPLAVASVVVVVAWTPFLSFEVDRDWVDLRTVVSAADSAPSILSGVEERLADLRFAVTHLGRSIHETVWLTPVLWVGVLAALALAVADRRWRDPGFAIPAAMVAAGVAGQVATDQGERTDVLMLWLVPLYALSAWAAARISELAVVRERGRRSATALPALVAVVVAVVGTVDLVHAIRATPGDQRLGAQWREARAGSPVAYPAALDPRESANRFYLPCDPPYDWGSEVWYLREALRPGAGIDAAEKRGAFAARTGAPCAR